MAVRPEDERSRSRIKPELDPRELRGAYRAVVEYNADPMRQGRVKVRLYQRHGPLIDDPEKWILPEDLPWALPAFPLGGGKGFGSFSVPPIGSTIWVMSIAGAPDELVYFGGYYQITNEQRQFLRALRQPKFKVSMVGEEPTVWEPPVGHEAPLDALEMVHGNPEISVQSKTVKGHTVVSNDRDERENLAIIDRFGQGLHFESEISEEANELNARQRGLRSVLRGEPAADISQDSVASETRVLLLDGAGGGFQAFAHAGSERVKIVSRPVRPDETNYGGHPEQMSVEIDSGSRRITLATGSSHDSKTRIVLDAASNCVEISGGITIKLNASSIEINGPLRVRGDLLVDGDTTLTGDAIVTGELTGGST